jgi:Ankyrin repeat
MLILWQKYGFTSNVTHLLNPLLPAPTMPHRFSIQLGTYIVSSWQDGTTPLHHAVSSSDAAIVGMLLRRGSNVNTVAKVSHSLLYRRKLI